MQTKVTVTLAFGFIMGLGLASCTSVESHRTVASDSPRYTASSKDAGDSKTECKTGESRSENGECVAKNNFDGLERPFRRGGR